MKNSTFAKTALSTLIALTLTACGHSSLKKDYQPAQSLIQKNNEAIDSALLAKAKAENALEKANEDISTLKKQIAELKQKGKDTSLLEAQLKKVNKEVTELAKKSKEMAKKEKTNADKLKALAKEKAKLAKEKTDAETKLKNSKQKLKEATSNISTLHKKIADAKLKELSDKAEQLKGQLEQAKATADKEVEKANKKVKALEKAKKDADTAKAEANKKIKALEDKIKELEKKGGNDTKATDDLKKELAEAKAEKTKVEKAVQKAKKEAEKAKTEAVKQVKEEAEKKIKPFEREKEYKDNKVAYVTDFSLVKDMGAKTPRAEFQKIFNDKFDFKKVFEGKTIVQTTDNALLDVKGDGLMGNVDINGHSLDVDRYDLNYSKLAKIKETIKINDGASTAESAVFAITGKPTDLTKVSFDELKSQNTGELTYKGKGLYAFHKIEEQGLSVDWEKINGEWKKIPKLKNVEKYDVMKEGVWAESNFKVNLKDEKIFGNIDFGDSDDALKVKFLETTISEKENQLQFNGKVEATQGLIDSFGDPSDYYLKEGKGKGTYQGLFMGPNAEELVGKFLIDQGKDGYKRDDSERGTKYKGKYTKFGNINGVFSAKKEKQVKTEPKYKLKK